MYFYVTLNITYPHSVTVALNHFIANTVDFTRMFTHELRLKTAVSITRCVNFTITIIGNDGLVADAITSVTGILAYSRRLVIA